MIAYTRNRSRTYCIGTGQEKIGKIASAPDSIGHSNSKLGHENMRSFVYHVQDSAWLHQADNPVSIQNIGYW
jgi:hypothetical protein